MTPSNFPAFADAVRRRFVEMSAGKLFVVNSDRDEIWARYLASFPKGADPMFRKKTEHDCGCCRHFIRAVGNVVQIKNGELSTVWDITGLSDAYQAVAAGMADYIRSCKVEDIYLTRFNKAGQASSVELTDDGQTITWEHFAVDVPTRFLDRDPGTRLAASRASYQVLKRGVEELTPESVATVLDLVESNALYRGAEFKDQLLAFQGLQNRLRGGSDLLLWESLDAPAARLRNSAIGTLLQDLSEGKDVENAVKAFESKVAPTNYKRPTAVITKGMVESAMKTITELDLEPALERRHAKLSDVSVSSVLWVDNSVRGKLKGGLAGKLLEEVKPVAFDPKKAKPIGIQEFLTMQHKQGVKVYLANTLKPNFVSLTAPVHPAVKALFKWSNDFAWSYEGNVADSMLRSQVAQLGGRVDGAFRFSHTWNYDPVRPNKSLMDLHVFMPGNSPHRDGIHNTYPARARVGWNRRNDYDSGGIQDVDYTQPPPDDVAPVENITFPDVRRMPEGEYVLKIHNWQNRPITQSGFKAEIEFEGQIFQYERTEAMANKEWVTVARVTLKDGQFSIEHVMPCGQASQDMWGLKTLDLVKVNAIVQSPNYWDDNAVGNKHWFFILEGCKNPQPCRGIYNEFLHPRLERHRKVFEVLGAKTKCPVADEQLSGVGFSSTKQDKVIAVSNGVAYAIQF